LLETFAMLGSLTTSCEQDSQIAVSSAKWKVKLMLTKRTTKKPVRKRIVGTNYDDNRFFSRGSAATSPFEVQKQTLQEMKDARRERYDQHRASLRELENSRRNQPKLSVRVTSGSGLVVPNCFR
jgi:hypothetical protein